MIQDTASTSTLISLICAREKSTNYGLAAGGMQSEKVPLTIYVASHSHSSVEKAALLAGFGRKNVRVIPHDAGYAMRADVLAETVARDIAAGMKPCAVVATCGTTTTTAFDPIAEIAAVAKKYSMWLHVDAAMAGSAMILPEIRGLWDGVEQADTLVFNPHKWMGAAFDCSTYYIRDPEHLMRVMSTSPSFLRSAVDGKVKNLRDWGIPLGTQISRAEIVVPDSRARSGRATSSIAPRHRERKVAGRASRARTELARAGSAKLQTVCVRHEPAGVTGEALDAHTQALCDRINRSGNAYLTPATLDGRWMVRVSIGAEATEREHVAKLWEWMREEAAKPMDGKNS